MGRRKSDASSRVMAPGVSIEVLARQASSVFNKKTLDIAMRQVVLHARVKIT